MQNFALVRHGVSEEIGPRQNKQTLKYLIDVYTRRWKDILERTVTELDREIAALSESKDALEQALEAKNLPTEVNVENLVTREGRRDIDVVEDEVEDQLQKVCESVM